MVQREKTPTIISSSLWFKKLFSHNSSCYESSLKSCWNIKIRPDDLLISTLTPRSQKWLKLGLPMFSIIIKVEEIFWLFGAISFPANGQERFASETNQLFLAAQVKQLEQDSLRAIRWSVDGSSFMAWKTLILEPVWEVGSGSSARRWKVRVPRFHDSWRRRPKIHDQRNSF